MKLPLVSPDKLIKILILKGYRKAGQAGSHIQFKNEKGTLITVPVHLEGIQSGDFKKDYKTSNYPEMNL